MSKNSTTATIATEVVWTVGAIATAYAIGFVAKKAYKTGLALKTVLVSKVKS